VGGKNYGRSGFRKQQNCLGLILSNLQNYSELCVVDIFSMRFSPHKCCRTIAVLCVYMSALAILVSSTVDSVRMYCITGLD